MADCFWTGLVLTDEGDCEQPAEPEVLTYTHEFTGNQPGGFGSTEGFGLSVAMDNAFAVVGSIDVGSGEGAVFVYQFNGLNWSYSDSLEDPNALSSDRLGRRVGVSGDYVIAGAHGDDAGGSGAGAAHIFFRDTFVWGHQEELVASDAAAGDLFGYSVAILGDYAIVGALSDGSNEGAAYVFHRTGTSWSQTQKLVASDAVANDRFGHFIFMGSLNGTDTAFISSRDRESGGSSDAGAVYVFTRSGGVWSQTQILEAPTPVPDDEFGTTVDAKGDTLAIGTAEGASYIFTFTTGWAHEHTIADSALEPIVSSDEQFIVGTGVLGLVGSDYEDCIFVYDRLDSYAIVQATPIRGFEENLEFEWNGLLTPKAESNGRMVVGYRTSPDDSSAREANFFVQAEDEGGGGGGDG